jgi:hypothetical protein
MSIIKSLQDFLETFDGMDMQPLTVKTDMADEAVSSYSVAPSGNGKISADILGNKTFQNNYVFYAREAAANEVDRQENYDFLEGFSEWLEEQNEEGNLPVLPAGYKTEELRVSNIMLFDVNEDGTGLYQVQLQLEFIKERKAII